VEAVVAAHAARSLSQPLPAPVALLPPPPPLPRPPSLPPHLHLPGTAASQPSTGGSRRRPSGGLANTTPPAVVMSSAREAARSRYDRGKFQLPGTQATDWDIANQYGTNLGDPRIMDLLHETSVSQCSIHCDYHDEQSYSELAMTGMQAHSPLSLIAC